MARFAKYKLGFNGNFLKDGHTMFPQDIVTDLKRKSFLEEHKLKLEDCLKFVQHSIHCMEQAGAFENNGLDQKMVKGILKRISETLGT